MVVAKFCLFLRIAVPGNRNFPSKTSTWKSFFNKFSGHLKLPREVFLQNFQNFKNRISIEKEILKNTFSKEILRRNIFFIRLV